MSGSEAGFDWRIYADATGAGLSALIPLPFLDLAVEALFRRRVPGAVCRARGVPIAPETSRALGQFRPWITLRGCLLAPVSLTLYTLKRLSRKLLYFLTVHEAVNSVSLYWHRAYLIDHLARRGHLTPPSPVDLPVEALERTLAEADTGALRHVARHVVHGSRHVLLTLLRARRRGAAEILRGPQAVLAGQWELVSAHLEKVARSYDAIVSRPDRAAAPGGELAAGRG
jgi:hypothetical protein